MYMYVHVCIFMYMYIACTYMFILVHNFINMYIHVCTMYRALCTDLQILVHVVRIPDDNFKSYWQVTNLNLRFKSWSAALSPRTGDRRGRTRKPAFQVVQVTHDNELEASLCEVQVSPSRTSQFRVSPSHGQRGSTRRR